MSGPPSESDDLADREPEDEGEGLLADGADAEPDEEGQAGLPPEGDDPMAGAAPSG